MIERISIQLVLNKPPFTISKKTESETIRVEPSHAETKAGLSHLLRQKAETGMRILRIYGSKTDLRIYSKMSKGVKSAKSVIKSLDP